MDLWQLRTFCIVAKNLHFTRAAEELNLSQPAVSHHIKALEKEIGEPLFLREKDGIWLTPIGETFYEHATKILDIVDELEFEIREKKPSLAGKLIIGGITRGLNNPFITFYEQFKKKYPELELLYQNEYDLEGLVKKIRSKEIDIGLLSYVEDLNGLSILPYGNFEMLLVAGKNHHLNNKKKVTIDDLRNEDWVMFESTHRLTISCQKLFRELEFVPKSIYETNDGSLIRTMVSRNEKIALLPEWGVFEDLQDGKLAVIDVAELRFKRQLNLIWRPDQGPRVFPTVITSMLEEEIEGIKLIN